MKKEQDPCVNWLPEEAWKVSQALERWKHDLLQRRTTPNSVEWELFTTLNEVKKNRDSAE